MKNLNPQPGASSEVLLKSSKNSSHLFLLRLLQHRHCWPAGFRQQTKSTKLKHPFAPLISVQEAQLFW